MPFGKIEPFDIASKKWTTHISRVKEYIALNSIKEELHVATLTTAVGAAPYDVAVDLCALTPPETTTFEELGDIVKKHLEPQRSDIAERCRAGVSGSSGVDVAQPGAGGASAMAVHSTDRGYKGSGEGVAPALHRVPSTRLRDGDTAPRTLLVRRQHSPDKCSYRNFNSDW
ncbi:hypothetical protein EVAR_4887_1 [Eumeta japonica]|uniref:Uncharacterized protein n=1 Tax=Eumeta variegata TaxID=151549 RepID=A0A4C1SZ72_EUMVA|nr:hypothetical protein EVAR_4887_1 [Eumeta japonica]